ncbi:hypothetical protein KJ671_04130 [Patescibacteria group bacterium]|nr:hypothetical protein [Patescibacteria group bacterium]
MDSFKEIINYILEFYNFIKELISSNLPWLHSISLLLSGLFLWGIIYIFIKTDYFNLKTEEYMDIFGVGNLTKRRSLKGWEQIRKRILSSDQQDWKIAILEADKILDEILKMSGYIGSDLDNRLELVRKENLAVLEEIKNAHNLARQIIKDPSMELKKENAIVALKSYKKAFIELNLLEE